MTSHANSSRFDSLRVAIVVTFGLISTACSLAPAVEKSSLDYDNTIEDVSNKSLVTNILRGRDGAPLYLTDLAQIRGGFNASAATSASLPYGPTFGSVQAGAFSASSTPSFDVNPSNTKKFYQGILNPISKNLFEYYIERDRASVTIAPIFYLLVAAVDITENGKTVTYNYDSSEFMSLADEWTNDQTPPRIIKSKPKTKSSKEALEEATVDNIDAKTLVEAVKSDLIVRKSADGKFHIEKKPSDETVICFHYDGGYIPIDIEDNSTVKAPSGDSAASAASNMNACSQLSHRLNFISPKSKYKIHLRSVEQVFYYLGFTLRADAGGPALFAKPPEQDRSGIDGCRRLSFYLSDHPIENARFSVSYRGEIFYVRNSVPVQCEGNKRNSQYDYTLQILETLNDLLNLNRDADEIPTTKAVQAVGPT